MSDIFKALEHCDSAATLVKALLETIPLDQRREVVLQALEGVAGEVVKSKEHSFRSDGLTIHRTEFRVPGCPTKHGYAYCELCGNGYVSVEKSVGFDVHGVESSILCLAAARAEKRRREGALCPE